MNVPDNGDVVGGKYRVLSKLGRGGMGTVLRAKNTLTGKEVALKWMHSSADLNSAAAARLLREAEAASRLNHPNVVNVFDVMYEGDTLFLVMELLEGETLRTYLNRNATPEIAELLSLLLPAMHGVAAAHEHGVIHRDLKPDNIFLVRARGQSSAVAKVVDFGVAKVLNSEGLTLTRTGTSLGTPLYMSLEQLRADEDIDQRTDVYAFGVILYEAITGKLPYTANTITEFAIKVATSTPTPVHQLRPEISRALAQLIEWAIERQREQRLPDMATLIRELEPFLRDAAVLTPGSANMPLTAAPTARVDKAIVTPTTLPFAHERDTSAASAHAPRWTRSRAAIAIVAGALAGLALLLYLLRRETPLAAPAATTSSAITALPPTPEQEPLAPLDPETSLDLPSGTAPPAEDKPRLELLAPAAHIEAKPPKRPRTTAKPKPSVTPAASSGSEPELETSEFGGRL